MGVAAFPVVAIPPGVMWAYCGATAPDGWFVCDGTTKDRTTYAALYAAVGFQYSPTPGTDPGSNLFYVPNMKGRVPTGIDTGQTEFDVRGESGGSKTAVQAHDHGTLTHTTHSSNAGISAHSGHANTGAISSHGNTGNDIAAHAHDIPRAVANTTQDVSATNFRSINVSNGTASTATPNIAHTHGGSADHTGHGDHGVHSDHTGHGGHGDHSDHGAVSTGVASGNLIPYLTVNYIIKW